MRETYHLSNSKVERKNYLTSILTYVIFNI